MNQNKRGVSLIVLIITIIVIIILAAAVILTINNNNPMDNANKARYMSDRANVQNALSTAVGKIAADKQCNITIPTQSNIESGIDYTLTGASDGIAKGKIGWDSLATVSSAEEATTILGMKIPNYGSNTRWFVNRNGEVSVEVAGVIYGPGMTPIQPGEVANGDMNYTVDGKTAVIPNGFYISTVPGEQSIDGGLVVIAPDPTASEFVWVPADAVDMFIEESGNYAGKLRSYTKGGNENGAEIISSPSGYREPDLVSNDNNLSNLIYINNILGLTLATVNDLKTMMQKEVNAMHESIRINKGFYIGRYETGDLSKEKVVCNKDNEDIANKTWYEMYAKQKKYATQIGTGVKSSMIYGSQWDAVMRWFAMDDNIKGYITDAEGKKGNWNKLSALPTGVDEIRNIYDMAGNVMEWTGEANSNFSRVCRGGHHSSGTDYQYLGSRDGLGPPYPKSNVGSRLVLYL